MKTVSIGIDDWKLKTFQEELDKANFEFEILSGITSDTLLLKVKCNLIGDLQPTVEKANKICSKASKGKR